jgi:hypothetical protein
VQRATILFVIVGSIIGTGIILSFYGNQIIFEELIKGEELVKVGNNLIIQVELDSTKIGSGVYAIQVMDLKERTITAKVLDPLDIEIQSQSINEKVFEGRFDITTPGTYKLVIENTGEKEVQIFGVIGPEPNAGKKSLGFISLYVLIIGLFGMVGVTIYVIKNRGKSFN